MELSRRDGHRFFNQPNFCEKGVVQNKTNDGWTKRIVQRSEIFFVFENERIKERFKIVGKKNLRKRSFSEKTNEIDGKWTIILRTNGINFSERLKKTNEIGRSQTINERKEKSWTCSSLGWEARFRYSVNCNFTNKFVYLQQLLYSSYLTRISIIYNEIQHNG